MQRNLSVESISSLISLVSTICDQTNLSSDSDDTDFIGEMEDYLESATEADSLLNIASSLIDSSNQEKCLKDEEKIFEGSKLSVNQFSFAFLFLVHKMKLSKFHRDYLYRFIKYFVPEKNYLPSSYSAIIKKFFKDTIKPNIIKMCNFCEEKIVDKDCTNQNCSKPEAVPKGVQLSYETIIFDSKRQIEESLEKNWVEIEDYKGKN